MIKLLSQTVIMCYRCKSLGLQELRPGTNLSNSECGPQSSRIQSGIIIGVVVASVLIAPAIIIIRIVILRRIKSPTTVTFSPVTVNAVEVCWYNLHVEQSLF